MDMYGDIGSYYTEISPDKLEQAHAWLRREAKQLRGSRCGRVCINRRGPKGVRWGRSYGDDAAEMELDLLFELLRWDYRNCTFTQGAEVILLQTWGIAMGTPPAPSNAITVAAFFEVEWQWSVEQDSFFISTDWKLHDRFNNYLKPLHG